jgi:hypothetical protein
VTPLFLLINKKQKKQTMGFKIKMPKVKMPKIPNPIKEIEKGVNQAGNVIVNTANTVVKSTEQIAKDAVNSAKSIAVGPVYQAYVDTTKNAMKQANVAAAAMDDIEAGAKLAAKGLEEGAYKVAEGGELIAEWAQANYCQIGVNLALGTLFGALLYRPEPSSQATTVAATAPLTATAIAYLAAKETVGKVALGTACNLTAQAFVELIWMSNDVRKAIGNSNKQILTDAIAFVLAKSIDKAAGAMVVPQSCAAVVAGVVTTLVAQLACERTLPNGAREWGSAGASGF